MQHRLAVLVCAALLSWLPGASSVSAQDDDASDPSADEQGAIVPQDVQAQVHFQNGRTHYNAGRFPEAAREFRLAYAESGRPELLYNVFLSERDAGNLPGAIEALRTYLELVPEVPNRAALEARLASMERLQQNNTTGAVGTAVPLQGPPAQGPQGQAVQPQPAQTQLASPEYAPTTPARGGGGGTWVPGWIIFAIGGAIAVASLPTGLLALDRRNQLDTLCGVDRRCPDGYEGLQSDGTLFAALTDGFLFGGIATAALGLVLALVISDGPSQDTAGDGGSLRVACGLTHCELGGTF